MTDSNLLKSIIIKNGYTIRKLAEHMGITAATLSQKINGQIKFSQIDIKKISLLFSLSPEEICNIFLK